MPYLPAKVRRVTWKKRTNDSAINDVDDTEMTPVNVVIR